MSRASPPLYRVKSTTVSPAVVVTPAAASARLTSAERSLSDSAAPVRGSSCGTSTTYIIRCPTPMLASSAASRLSRRRIVSRPARRQSARLAVDLSTRLLRRARDRRRGGVHVCVHAPGDRAGDRRCRRKGAALRQPRSGAADERSAAGDDQTGFEQVAPTDGAGRFRSEDRVARSSAGRSGGAP